jgi:LEA14-like dessication related protein
MKKMSKIKMNIIAVFICCTAFLSCDVLSGVASFVNCKYEFGGLSNPAVAGVSLSNLTNLSGLNAMSLLKLTTGILAGSLPIDVTFNIKATNPNSTAAQIAGLDWAIDMDKTSNVLAGTLEHAVSIPANGGQTVIPLVVQTDLVKLFKSKDDIFGFVNNLLNVGTSNSNIGLRIRPSVSIAGQKISTGFINIK